MFLGVVYGIIVFMSRSTGCGVWLGLGVWCVVMSDWDLGVLACLERGFKLRLFEAACEC